MAGCKRFVVIHAENFLRVMGADGGSMFDTEVLTGLIKTLTESKLETLDKHNCR
jgi:hypothetical protein